MLDDEGLRLLRLLVSKLHSANPDYPERMIGYKDAHEQLGLSQIRADWAESLKAQGLDNLAEWTKAHEKPAITGIIVNQGTHSPGRGYYSLFGRTNDDFTWWRAQIIASKEHDWSAYFAGDEADIDSNPPTSPKAVDLTGPTDRQDITVSRIIRDTIVARRVKKIHDFKCQICGLALNLADGVKYAEGHHIKPLGTPHNGPDIIENIMCLCPNHHALLDYGALYLEEGMVRHLAGHRIGREYIDYHNANVQKVR